MNMDDLKVEIQEPLKMFHVHLFLFNMIDLNRNLCEFFM